MSPSLHCHRIYSAFCDNILKMYLIVIFYFQLIFRLSKAWAENLTLKDYAPHNALRFQHGVSHNRLTSVNKTETQLKVNRTAERGRLTTQQQGG